MLYPEGNNGIANGIAEAANERISVGLVNILSTVKTVLYVAGAAIIIGTVITVIVVLKNKKR